MRLLKINEIGDFFRQKTKPQIVLAGHWLAQAGFPPGAHVQVDVQPGQLTITLSRPDETGSGKEVTNHD